MYNVGGFTEPQPRTPKLEHPLKRVLNFLVAISIGTLKIIALVALIIVGSPVFAAVLMGAIGTDIILGLSSWTTGILFNFSWYKEMMVTTTISSRLDGVSNWINVFLG